MDCAAYAQLQTCVPRIRAKTNSARHTLMFLQPVRPVTSLAETAGRGRRGEPAVTRVGSDELQVHYISQVHEL